jgi:hypothetical protein
MTPKLIISGLLLFIGFQSFGQTNTVTALKVGIGTTTPGFPLHVLAGSNTAPATYPILHIGYNGKAENHVGETGAIIFAKHYDLNTTAKIYTFEEWSRTNYFGADIRFATGTDAGLIDRLVISNDGNVLIDKLYQQNKSYRLDVNGKVRANEVVVNTTGADFVFAKDYDLMPLTQVERFISKHGHLPGIAPAAEMQKEGVGLGELNTQLLQKIEEMTLHQIKLEKTLQAALERIEKLEREKSSI